MASKDCKRVMRKRKEGWEEANSWHMIYLVVSVDTKPPLVHAVEALTQEYCFPVTKSLPRAPLDSPQRPPLRHSPSSLGHLDAASTKELLHQGRGVSTPPHKVSSPLHTKSEGRRRLPVSHLGPKASDAPCTTWFTQESPHKVRTTLHSLRSKLILALSTHTHTHTKHMQVYGWAISTWMDLRWSSRCLALLSTFTQSNNLKWVSGGGYNCPKAPKEPLANDHWKVDRRMNRCLLFRSIGSSDAPPMSLSHGGSLTELLWCTVGSFGAEVLLAKTLLLVSTKSSDEPLLTRRFIWCCCSSLGASLSCSNLIIR
jgi:hypothetical protein